MQKNNTAMWIWGIVIVVIVALGIWWYSMSMSSNPSDMASSTDMTATTTGTGTTGTPTGGSSGSQQLPVTTTSQTVAAITAGISGSSVFNGWLGSTGVAAQITGKGPFTVFVPTNGSISQLPAGTFTNLNAAGQKRFVQYHVISGKQIDADAETAGSIQALSGDPINFSYGANKIPMVNSSIIIAEYKGSNGVVYLIDNPLLPPKK